MKETSHAERRAFPVAPSRRRLTILIMAGAALFALAAVLVDPNHVAGWEIDVFRWFNDTGGYAGVAAVLAAPSTPVGLTILAILGVAFMAASYRRRAWVPIALAAGAAALTWAVDNLLKLIVERGRPSTFLAAANVHGKSFFGSGFPSSHAAVTTAVCVALWPFFPRRARWVLVVVDLLVLWSRMYFGAHFPLDILGGAGVGVACGGAALLAWAWFGREASSTCAPTPASA